MKKTGLIVICLLFLCATGYIAIRRSVITAQRDQRSQTIVNTPVWQHFLELFRKSNYGRVIFNADI